jgi:hypothetical protein
MLHLLLFASALVIVAVKDSEYMVVVAAELHCAAPRVGRAAALLQVYACTVLLPFNIPA